PAIAILGTIAIVYASLACLAQRDLKRLIAFSSVGHMGFVMLAIATMTTLGVNAAIFGMVAHGVITGMLFFEVGSIYDRYHTREIAEIGCWLGSWCWACSRGWCSALRTTPCPPSSISSPEADGEPMQAIDYHAIAPELVLTGTILMVIVLDAFLPRERKWMAMPVALIGVLG